MLANYAIFIIISTILIFSELYLHSKRTANDYGKNTFNSLEKRNNLNGNFQYFHGGFFYHKENHRSEILWSDVELIEIKRYSFDDNTLEYSVYIKAKNKFHKINNDEDGFVKFVNTINSNLNISDPLWTWNLHNKSPEMFLIYDKFATN